MKYISLCSGIGGIEVGLQKAFPQAKCVGYSEIDKGALKVYQNHFPDHDNLGCLIELVWKRKKNGKIAKRNGEYVINEDKVRALPDIDCLVGGTPCTDLSIANINRKGLKGLQSRLLYAYLAILRIKKPKYFFLENVASMSKKNRDKISALLGVEPVVINSDRVSAQSRSRLYWCNWPLIQPQDRGILFDSIMDKKHPSAYNLKNRELEFFSDVMKSKKTHWNFGEKFKRHEKVQLLAYSRSIRETDKGKYDEKRFRVNGKANTLVTGNGCGGSHSKNLVLVNGVLRKLTPGECGSLQTFPKNWHEGITDNQAYKCYGNAVTTEVIYEIFKQHPLYKVKRKKKLLKRK